MWKRLFSRAIFQPSLRYCSLSYSPLASSCNISVTEDGKKLHLVCDGEQERRYHGIWLRHNCRCPECLPVYSQQNIVHYSHLVDLKLANAKVEGNHVRVEWNSATGDHSCNFDIEWLKKYDYTTPGIHEERKKNELPLVAESLPTMEYKDIMSSIDGYFEWMKQINFYGIVLLKNVSTIDKYPTIKIFERIAEPQKIAHPGLEVFDLIAVDNPTNFAYTKDDLIFHMDSNHYESPPGIMAFFCLKFDDCVEGGESYFVDAYPVLEELRRKHPKHFEVLTRVPYVNHRVHDSVDNIAAINYKYSMPHVSLNHHDQICGFSWSPQHLSPQLGTEKEVEDYYEAFVILSSMLNDSPLKIVHRIKPGEAVVFNNRRFLHSRNAFKTNGGERHIQLSYCNIDFFRSKFAVLSKQLNKNVPVKHMFNRSFAA